MRTWWFIADVVLLLVAWQVIATFVPGANQVLPPVPVVWEELNRLITSGDLLRHTSASVERTLGGFGLAVCTALPIGLWLGSSRRALQIADPLIEVLRPISPIAWIPLSILWFGIGEASKIFIIWLIAFFFILLNTINGVRSVDSRLLDAARTLGGSRPFLWRKVVLWAALPSIFVGLRLGLGVSIGGVLIAEMVAADSGIGFLMERSRVVLSPAPMVVGMVVIALLGYGANRLIMLLEARIMPYRSLASIADSGRNA